MKTALLFDDDLGFLLWMAEVLCAIGYLSYPADNVMDVAAFLGQIQGDFDLAIVNVSLLNAALVVQWLAASTPAPQIFALEPEPSGLRASMPGVTGWLTMPDTHDEASWAAWRESLRMKILGKGREDNASAASN